MWLIEGRLVRFNAFGATPLGWMISFNTDDRLWGGLQGLMECRFVGMRTCWNAMTRCVVSVAKGECSSFCMTVVDRTVCAASEASDLLMRKSRRGKTLVADEPRGIVIITF
jgi:hypothetical protein